MFLVSSRLVSVCLRHIHFQNFIQHIQMIKERVNNVTFTVRISISAINQNQGSKDHIWNGIQAVKMIESDHKIWQPHHVIARQLHAIIRSSRSSNSNSSSGSSISSSRFKRLNVKYV